MRRAAALLCLLAAGCAAGGADGDIVSARYETDLDVYPHRIMGSIREKAVLVATDDNGRDYRTDLRDAGPDHPVFEDVAPRVVDADGDGKNEIVVVESSRSEGAQLAVYALMDGRLAKVGATPHIGTRFRWLAPVAVADLDGDGVTDIAYVDRPHLAKTLRILTWARGRLVDAAALQGVTNHRIGDESIWGGLRDCGSGPEMVLADASFREVVTVRWAGDVFATGRTGLPPTPENFDRVLACR